MAKQAGITNERELTSKLVEWLNEIIKRNRFPFNEATNEAPTRFDSSVYFGDIVFWSNRQAQAAYAYLEIKPPFASKENLETLRKKAVSFNVQYCFTWDFQNLNVYKVNGNNIELVQTQSAAAMSNINDWLRGDVQAIIKKYLLSLCDDIVHLNDTGKLRGFVPDKVYFVNYIRFVVNRLIPLFEQHYIDKARDRNNKNKILSYSALQGISHKDPADYYKLIARQSVYTLVTKLIFYLTIRRYFDELPDLYNVTPSDLERFLRSAFVSAQQKDWQAVFEESEIEKLGIPSSSHSILLEFFHEMKAYHFGELPEDVIGELFEEIIEPESRHSLGQYFTNENLVDLILGFTVHSENKYYADVTCGSGTFLIRAYDRIKHISKSVSHAGLLSSIWGFDIAKFPAELATINLFRQCVSNFENFPRVRCADVFNVNAGDSYEFPPPSAGKSYNKVSVELPRFDAIVGNFPFIRQELIEKTTQGYKNVLTKALANDHFFSYPKLFSFPQLNEGMINHLAALPPVQKKKEINRYVDGGYIQLKLSGQADIYAYIFIHAASLLAEGGMFAIITSNSWLDTSYGSVLKEFFLDHFKVRAVIASWAEPWFDDAAVNTVVTILEKENNQLERAKNITRFVKLKKKLTELIPFHDLKLESVKRWQSIDAIVQHIETAEYHHAVEKVTDTISSLTNDDMRIRLVPQSVLYSELIEKGEYAKWSKYLRAPDVYFEILDKCSSSFVPLENIAKVRRGYTTGINDFFYLEITEPDVLIDAFDKNPARARKIKDCVYCSNSRGWRGYIEKCYLRPVIKSPKEAESIIIKSDSLRYQIFICNESKADLRKKGHQYALKYIEWGEKQKTTEGIYWTETPSVQGRNNWHSINEKEPGNILLQMINNDRFAAFRNVDHVHVDHNLFEWLVEDDMCDSAVLFLNSSLFSLFRELNSRVNLGDGATKTEGVDWSNLMLAPKKPLKIKFSFEKLFNRKILSIFDEVTRKDRQQLDTKVLQALGLDPLYYLPRIYDGLCEIVRERLELPKMRKKKQQDEVKYSFDKIKEDVIADCIPDGVRVFPDNFYNGNFDELEFETYSVPGTPLNSEPFFDRFDIKDDKNNIIAETKSPFKAEYIVLLSQKNIFQIKVPSDEKIVKNLIADYKTYIKNIKELLTENARSKLHDWSIAEKMAVEILKEFGLG